MGLTLPAELVSRIVCSICSIDNITGRTTLRNQEDAKGQRLKQSRPAFAAQEGLVDFRGRRQQCGFRCGFRAQFPPGMPPAPAFVATLLETPGRSRGKSPDSCPTNPCLTLIRRTPCLIHEGALRKAAAQLGARSRGRAPPGTPPRRGALRSPTREACQLGICQLNFLLEIAPSWTKTVDM